METEVQKEFINRKEDLETLKSIWNKKGAQFLVCYGRRRIGKTALLDFFAQKNELLHYLAFRASDSELLADFSFKLYSFLNNEEPEEGFTFGSWKVAFETLALFAKKKKIGVIIDEFPYLVESNTSISSILQAVWDKHLSKSQVLLVLSGSQMGMIKEEILSSKAPLYGRATAIFNLKPISLYNLCEFYPKMSPVQWVEIFGISGGVPKYFEFIHQNKPVLTSLEESIKVQTTFLTSEPEFLLHDEFREVRLYLSILRSLSHGRKSLQEIGAVCGINTKVLSKYVDDLMSLKIIAREVAAGQDPLRSRKGLYRMTDPFLNFHFHFIDPFRLEMESGRFEQPFGYLRKNFDSYIGRFCFENICREWLKIQVDQKKLPFHFDSLGTYWDAQTEIDILGLDKHDQVILVGECKWQNQKVGLEVIKNLEAKSHSIGFENYHREIIFFSKSGFSPQAEGLAKKRHYRLVTVNDIFK